MELEHYISINDCGQRLDQVAAAAFSDYSRSQLQRWIKNGLLTINGKQARPKDKVLVGEHLLLRPEIEFEERWLPQAIDVDVVYQDQHIIVINKPAGLVVHPGAGIKDGTLLNALLHHFPEVAQLPRAGIVHRLDKNTTGLMVVARSLKAHTGLVKQLQTRSLGREYEAVVMGEMVAGGTVNQPIGRHPHQRIKMAVLPHSEQAKEAITHYRVLKRYQGYSYIACQLATGRAHQIRVHMAYQKHPLVGDATYLGRQRWIAGTSSVLRDFLVLFPRQALHAKRLTLIHPDTNAKLSWEATLPEDLQQLLQLLEREA